MKLIELLRNPTADLYHGTIMKRIPDIFHIDKLLGKTIHKVDGKIIKGVSVTRSFRYARYWSTGSTEYQSIVLVLDQQKLKFNHKILPLDWFQNTYAKSERRSEAEEFIIGDIYPLHKFLKKVILERPFEQWSLVDLYLKTYNIPITIIPNHY